MTDLRYIFHYLKIQVNHVIRKKITLYKNTYFKKIFDRFKMTDYKPVSIPMNPGIGNLLLLYNRNINKETIKWYQSAIGSFIWPAIYTRLDIAYIVGVFN